MMSWQDKLEKDIQRLEAQNKKLRNALEEVGNLLYEDFDGIGDLQTAWEIIQDALKDGE